MNNAVDCKFLDPKLIPRPGRSLHFAADESGQALIGGLISLLLAMTCCMFIFGWAMFNRRVAKEVADSQNAGLLSSMHLARQLNEIAQLQSMAIWHLHQVLLDRQELREVIFLSASVRKYTHTNLGNNLQQPLSGVSKLRDAISNRTALGFAHLEALLSESQGLAEILGRSRPMFATLIEPLPLAVVACEIARQWIPVPMVNIPIASQMLRLLGLGAFLHVRSVDCLDTFSSAANGAPLVDSTFDIFGDYYPLDGRDMPLMLAQRRPVFYRFKSHVTASQLENAFALETEGVFRVRSTVDHPLSAGLSALFDPRWVPKIIHIAQKGSTPW